MSTSTAIKAANDEQFAELLFQGATRTQAYLTIFPGAAGKNPETVRSLAQKYAVRDGVVAAVQERRNELVAAGIWRRSDSVETLAELARFAEKDSDRIGAIKELNSMHGYNAPTQINLQTVERVVVEYVPAGTNKEA